MPRTNETNWDLIITGDELKEVAGPRGKEFIEKSVRNEDVDSYMNQGWTVKKANAKKTTIIKPKEVGDAFEDEVWSIFYNMGFKYMNKDNSFAVVYSTENGLSKQIDVVAIDDEICLLIECKEAEHNDTRRSFQMDINEVPSFFNKVCSVIKTKFPNVKCKYIFATKNVIVGKQDKSRMKEHNIIHFDYSAVLYYKALVDHLGSAARFQLLGQIFAGQKISNMDVKIPAIRGKMGGLTYYSFLMEPEKLLKISYVLHKTNANNEYEDLLPSYQRLIKKDRLQSVRDFINNENFFPNSIILSIDARRPLIFDIAPADYNQSDLSKMGILHLPQVYQSAYIIDGQHRLYGYSDSNFQSNNSIPVVAFENLDKMKQLKLFMEINMNQKAVPKALKNILEIDVYYDSNDPKLAQSALLGNIAKHLGEDTASSLKGRVIIGEDAGTKRCCITIENIKLALDKTHFFNKLKRNGQVQPNGHGLFDKNNSGDTFECVYPLIMKYFNAIRDEFSSEWNQDDSFFVKNNIVGAYIRLQDDMVTIAYEKDNTIINNLDSLWNAISNHLTILLLALGDLTPEDRDYIIKQRGAAAPTNVYRLIEMHMFELDSTFTNTDIENYYVEHYKNYNEDAKPEIVKIKETLLDKIKGIFNETNWMRIHLSEQHENDLTSRVNAKNNANERNGIDIRITAWDEINFNDIHKMINHASNWTNYFKNIFTEMISDCTKNSILSLMLTIGKCNDNIRDGHKITGSDYNEIHSLYNAIVGE